jgi:hypothetical protein
MNTHAILQLYRHDFKQFILFAFRELNPTTTFIDNWHIDLIADRLMGCRPGGSIKRLMINVPPRYLKSFITSVCWPLFMSAHYPGTKITICAGAHDLATDLELQRERLLSSPRLKAVFPNLRVRPAPGRTRFENGSEIVQSTVGRSQMGRGADIYIIDDPHSAVDVEKTGKRLTVHDWYQKDVVRGLNKKKSAVVVIVMQRLHHDDLCAMVSRLERWDHVTLAAISRADERWQLSDGRCVVRKAYEPLAPRQESREDLLHVLTQLRGLTFFAQYLQRPQFGAENHGNGRIKSYVYDGWKIGQPMFSEPVFISQAMIIRRDYFGERDHRWRPGWRLATREERDLQTAVMQRKMLERLRAKIAPPAIRDKWRQPVT